MHSRTLEGRLFTHFMATLIVLAVIGTAAGASASSGFDSLHPEQGPAVGVGNNGQILDPYLRTITNWVAPLPHDITECEKVAVSVAQIAARCGDSDGCTLRLSSDGAEIDMRSAKSQLLLTDATGRKWSLVNLDGSGQRVGDLDDGNAATLLQIIDIGLQDWCQLRDEGGLYELKACLYTYTRPPLRCTLQVAD